MNKVLILGGSGLIGKAIINQMNKDYEIYSTYYKHEPLLDKCTSFKLNIEDLENINYILNNVKPQIIISCIRGDYNKQMILHKKAAEYLKENGGCLYFFSTANVFDNDLSKSHYEDDLPNSSTDYGRYKIACEKIITEILKDNACILRIPQVFGKHSPRIIQLLSSLNNNKAITVYPKLFINTNTDVMIANQLCYIIKNKLKGIFHLTSEDIYHDSDFYNELVMKLGFNNVKFEENFEEEGHFALLSKRNDEFPKNLRLDNKFVIDYLTEK